MSEISVININDKEYNVKDSQARNDLADVSNAVENDVLKKNVEEEQVTSGPVGFTKYIKIGNAKITDDGTTVTFE